MTMRERVLFLLGERGRGGASSTDSPLLEMMTYLCLAYCLFEIKGAGGRLCLSDLRVRMGEREISPSFHHRTIRTHDSHILSFYTKSPCQTRIYSPFLYFWSPFSLESREWASHFPERTEDWLVVETLLVPITSRARNATCFAAGSPPPALFLFLVPCITWTGRHSCAIRDLQGGLCAIVEGGNIAVLTSHHLLHTHTHTERDRDTLSLSKDILSTSGRIRFPRSCLRISH